MLLMLSSGGDMSEQVIKAISDSNTHIRSVIEKKVDQNWQKLEDIDNVIILLEEFTPETEQLIADCNNSYSVPLIIIANDVDCCNQIRSLINYTGLCIAQTDVTAATIPIILNCAEEMHRKHVQVSDYHRMFRENPMPMFVYDVATMRFITVNDAAIKKYGYSLPEFQAMTIKDIRPPEEVPKLQKVLPHQPKTGYHDFGIWPHRKKDGTDFYVHIVAYRTIQKGKSTQVVIANDVDEQVRAENENKILADRLEQNRKIVDGILTSVNEMIWSRNVNDQTITYANAASKNIYGINPEELIGSKGVLDGKMIHPDDKHILEAQIKKLLETDYAEAEYRIINNNGETKYVLSKGHLSRKPDGKPDFITGTTSDITELRTTQKKLQEKAEELEMVMDTITDGFLTLDKDFNFLYVNKAFEQLYGTTKEYILGRNYWEFFPKAKEQKFYKQYRKALKDQKPTQFEEYSNILKKWLSVNIYPVKNGLSIYFTDVTEDHELQRKIKESERTLNTIINNTEDIIWAVDKNLQLIYANNSFIEGIKMFSGIDAKPGDKVLSHQMPGNLKEYERCYRCALNDESCQLIDSFEFKNETYYFETNFYPVHDDDTGQVTSVTAFMKNVTERRKYVNTIEQQNERLKHIAWLHSHKVRSEVARILGMAEIFNKENYADPSNKIILENVRTVCNDLDKVIREVNKQTQLVDLDH